MSGGVTRSVCADHFSSNPPTDTTSYIINAKTLLPGKSQASSLVSGPSTSPSTRSNSVIERISGWKPTSSANTPNAPVRKPRRKAAQLDEVARKKTWDGTKSKNRKDRINDKEKLAAAVWHAAAAGGVAVSLNLGIRREGMLLNHDDPRRRMMQNLHKQLSAVGLSHVPYAMVFEMTPEREGERLHLHGVIDTSDLDQGDRMRLSEALCKAASLASGAIGGLRQLEMVDLHNAPGWADYLLKDATRTARELGIEHPFMLNTPMKREAKVYFEQLRASQGERLQGAQSGAPGLALTDGSKRKKVS